MIYLAYTANAQPPVGYEAITVQSDYLLKQAYGIF